MTTTEMMDAVRVYLEDPGKQLISDQSLRLILQRSLEHVWSKSIVNKIYHVIETFDVTITEQETTIAGTRGDDTTEKAREIYKIIFATDSSGTTIPVLPKKHARNSKHPAIYIQQTVATNATDNTILLGYYMAPGSVTLTINYVPRMHQYFEAGSVQIYHIPPEYHDLIVNYAVFTILAKDQHVGTLWSGIYLDSLDTMIAANTVYEDGVVDVYDDA